MLIRRALRYSGNVISLLVTIAAVGSHYDQLVQSINRLPRL